jgi:hypothetical protein
MDWEPVAIIAIGALSVVLLVLTGLRERAGRRRASELRARVADAEASALRAREAAIRSSRAARRSADAVERIAKAAERDAVQAERRSPGPGVTWTLEHVQGKAYRLTNVGRAAAYEVVIHLDPAIRTMGELRHEVLEPSGSIKFMAVLTPESRDDTVTVTWKGRTLVEHVWSRPLPPITG